jgi:phage tail-like protein
VDLVSVPFWIPQWILLSTERGKKRLDFANLQTLRNTATLLSSRGLPTPRIFANGDNRSSAPGADGARKNKSIILINKTKEDIARWDIVRAWPTKCDPAQFSAEGNEVAMKTLEIVNEGLKRVS